MLHTNLTCLYMYSLTGRAKSLANDVSGEAYPFEDLSSFQPENGAILANATPLGMHPKTADRIPVPEVFSLHLRFLVSFHQMVANALFLFVENLEGIQGCL